MQASQFIERVVAGIHSLVDKDADVRWDERIGGRQFDVTARYRHGLYIFLLAIECRHKSRAVQASEIEAFVTKARDAGADKAAFVTISEFQSGAIAVAKAHNVKALRVEFSAEPSAALRTFMPDMVLEKPKPFYRIHHIGLHYIGGTMRALPDEQSAMTYCVKQTICQTRGREISLANLIDEHLDTLGKERKIGERITTSIQSDLYVVPPDELFLVPGRISQIDLQIAVVETISVRSQYLVDPGHIVPDVCLIDVMTGEKITQPLLIVPLGIGTTLESGKYYAQEFPPKYYYVDLVKNGTAFIYLVESFQNGQLLQGKMSGRVDDVSKYYVEVKEPETIRRLATRLRKFRGKEPARASGLGRAI